MTQDLILTKDTGQECHNEPKGQNLVELQISSFMCFLIIKLCFTYFDSSVAAVKMTVWTFIDLWEYRIASDNVHDHAYMHQQ